MEGQEGEEGRREGAADLVEEADGHDRQRRVAEVIQRNERRVKDRLRTRTPPSNVNKTNTVDVIHIVYLIAGVLQVHAL